MPILQPNNQAPQAAPFPELTGQDLVNLVNSQLLGYAGSVPNELLISYINEAKDRLWSILVEENEAWFECASQSTDQSKFNFFPPLQTNQREYQLPSDFRRMKFIEVLTQGYESTTFIYKPQRSQEWSNARICSNSDGSPSPVNFYQFFYDIIGNNTMTIAQYPGVAFNLRIWYIRVLKDIDASQPGPIDGILMPFARNIASFATKRATLALQDLKLWEAWKEEWKEQVLALVANAGTRQEVDAVFVDDFYGDEP